VGTFKKVGLQPKQLGNSEAVCFGETSTCAAGARVRPLFLNAPASTIIDFCSFLEDSVQVHASKKSSEKTT
jgi:hypothetical protein